jgi:hypothetical protein
MQQSCAHRLHPAPVAAAAAPAAAAASYKSYASEAFSSVRTSEKDKGCCCNHMHIGCILHSLQLIMLLQ